MDKRAFLKTTGLIGLGTIASFPALSKLVDSVSHLSNEAVATDDDFWLKVRGDYTLNTNFINLENGYYCIQPKEILDAYIRHIRDVNMQGAYYMRTVQAENKAKMVAKLCELTGTTPETTICTRNTTESLDMVIMGMDWKPGDEAVMAYQDYGAMLDMFKQTARRYGMVNKSVNIPKDPKSDEEIVALYEKAITPKTRLLMVCHMINITGQILPVRKICDMAHSKGVPVMVDGAHALAHIDFKIPALNCDYYGSSLHKWLSVPIGAGLLYVNKERISGIWPIFAESGKSEGDILKLNHTGTHPPATDLTISDAIDYYQKMGAERKEARLRYLQNYWTDKVRAIPNIMLNTPTDKARSCGIANVGVRGRKAADLQRLLLERYKIYTVAIDSAGVIGVRVTPNVYTTTAELDALVRALTELAG